MHPTLKIAINAAKNAGKVILRHHNQIDRLTISNKAAYDFVSEVDKYAEEIIISEIRKYFPKHSILGEESGELVGDKEWEWVIDPLDGTTNFLHGFPQYAVSIALFNKGVINYGVVFDPFKDELWSASKGSGAFLNAKRIRVSSTKNMVNTLIGTGFPFKQPEHLDTYLAMFKAIHPLTSGIRRAGSAALDLAYLASGRLDGFWEIGLSKWDIAAGALLIQEAGGFISDFSGSKNYFKNGDVVAGNPTVYKTLLKTIQPYINKIQ